MYSVLLPLKIRPHIVNLGEFLATLSYYLSSNHLKKIPNHLNRSNLRMLSVDTKEFQNRKVNDIIMYNFI